MENSSSSSSRKAVIVGISGASSSGKTTLARLLRDVFPNTFVLHEDDFYRPETEYVCTYRIRNLFLIRRGYLMEKKLIVRSDRLPTKDGLVDWDCAEALYIPDMVKALSWIRENGTFPVSAKLGG